MEMNGDNQVKDEIPDGNLCGAKKFSSFSIESILSSDVHDHQNSRITFPSSHPILNMSMSIKDQPEKMAISNSEGKQLSTGSWSIFQG